MNRIRITPFALLLAAAVATAGAAAPVAAGEEPETQHKMKLVWNAGGASDRLVVEDLDLAPGETRQLATESGQPVSVTRDADGDGYELDLDGRKIRIADGEGLALEPGRRVVMKKIELDGDGEAKMLALGDGEDGEPVHRRVHRIEIGEDGETKSFVVSDGHPKVMLFHGEPGAEGFAFRAGPGPHPFGVDGLLERIEKSEKFLALDDTTREIVREVVRDAAPKLRLRKLEPGDDEAFDVWIERRDDAGDD